MHTLLPPSPQSQQYSAGSDCWLPMHSQPTIPHFITMDINLVGTIRPAIIMPAFSMIATGLGQIPEHTYTFDGLLHLILCCSLQIFARNNPELLLPSNRQALELCITLAAAIIIFFALCL